MLSIEQAKAVLVGMYQMNDDNNKINHLSENRNEAITMAIEALTYMQMMEDDGR